MDSLFHTFRQQISDIELPQQFNFPFYYEPHPLARIAAQELQDYLDKQSWFCKGGLQQSGKMFGVLVVSNSENEIGYLAGFSGKLAGETTQKNFVPPVYELERVDLFFKEETAKLDQLTQQIAQLENDPETAIIYNKFKEQNLSNYKRLEIENERIKKQKRERRKYLKEQKQVLSEIDFTSLEAQLRQQSLNNNFFLKEYESYLHQQLSGLKAKYDSLKTQIDALKEKRKLGSNWLQDWLFDEYHFLNAYGQTKSVKQIFKTHVPDTPPAATGDCAAPKLLQYAYKNELSPITMAEFWYGPAPKSKVRQHGNFYPSCRSKCEPVLGFMLQGLDVEDNPLLKNTAADKTLDILFEDEYMLAINKPAELLSVAGKTISDSVQTRMKILYPDATGPMIVHRLDMSTSGILLIAKTLDVYHHLQSQFTTRTIDKRYIAILEGEFMQDAGFIDLPLRVDLDNRPYQLVDPVYGKSARTRFEVIERQRGRTKVHFYPITGRTHQLRVHAAHKNGLNTPIVGDDLYGKKDQRLHLHAEKITFLHPITKETKTVTSPAPFNI